MNWKKVDNKKKQWESYVFTDHSEYMLMVDYG